MGKAIVNFDMSERYNTLEELAEKLKCPLKTLEGIVTKNTIRNGNTKINGQIYKYINTPDKKVEPKKEVVKEEAIKEETRPVKTLKEELMGNVKVPEKKKETTVERKPQREKNFSGVFNLTLGLRFDTIEDAAKKFKVSKTCIRDAANGVQKTSAGCKWMYNDEYLKAKEAGLLEEIVPKEIETNVVNLVVKKDTVINIKVV